MKSTNSHFWKYNIFASIVLLMFLIFANFYGLFTDRFYFLKIENYLFPVLTIIHFVYMYVIRFKIVEKDYPDIQMRNLEYCFYIVVVYYLYRIIDLSLLLYIYDRTEGLVLPTTFLPATTTILSAYVVLLLLALHLFKIRSERIGFYQIDYYSEENLDVWP